MRILNCGLLSVAWIGLVCAGTVRGQATTAPSAIVEKTTVIAVAGTLETAIGQPRINVQLRDAADNRVQLGRPLPLSGRNEPDLWFVALLDTSAGGMVISHTTAERFGVRAQGDSSYVNMGVGPNVQRTMSVPYGLVLGASSGSPVANQASSMQAAMRDMVLQIDPEPPAHVLSLESDVIGMAAISRLLVEMEAAPMRPSNAGHGENVKLGVGPTVRVRLAAALPPAAEVTVPFEYRDFNQPADADPKNGAKAPSLGMLPVIPGVMCEHRSASVAGNWLLDTGVVMSFISTAQAKALGLIDVDGAQPRTPGSESAAHGRKPDFTLPVRSFSRNDAAFTSCNGFIIDKLKLKANDNRVIEFQSAHVLVMDVPVTLADRKEIILDGVLGMNLLLPSVKGLAGGSATASYEGAFARVWIDGPHALLGLQWRR